MIKGITQPDIIEITSTLRLRKYDHIADFALAWYKQRKTVKLVHGHSLPYTTSKLQHMYNYLDNYGELYFIEIFEQGTYLPIGDVTFHREDIPIVIGEERYRNCGIGSLVLQALITRAKSLGYEALHIREIFDYNTASKRLFEKHGFTYHKRTKQGASYVLQLEHSID